MYTLHEIEEKIKLAKELGLSGAELLEDRERAMRVCNGIGAEWMPDSARKLISSLNPTLVLAADIHDLRYETGGTTEERKAADDEMLENGCKLAEARYGWYNPLRYWVKHKMRRFYKILRAFGFLAWNYREGYFGGQ